MRILLVVLLLQRTYWSVPLDTLAIGHLKHTHVSTRGVVLYCRSETDGDRHIKLKSLKTTRFIVGEVIPKIPFPCPKVGDTITLQGITRMDPEHAWAESSPYRGMVSMSYPTGRPRPVGRKPRPNIVKGFVRGRPARPIQGVAAARPLRTARLRTPARGLGSTEDYAYADAAMGDDYSDAGGMGNWFTDAISRPFEAIGLTSPDDIVPVEYNRWRGIVISRGHTVGRMPSGANAGQWAEISTANGQRYYALAPAAVLQEDAKIASIIERQRAAGVPATTATKILEGLKPPNLASSLTGIPKWMFPVLLIGGGYMVLKSVLPQQRQA
jgi:hypothetical protein